MMLVDIESDMTNLRFLVLMILIWIESDAVRLCMFSSLVIPVGIELDKITICACFCYW
jgi:hypothetical protein